MEPKTIRAVDWPGQLPEIGNYLRTKKGTTYLVIAVKLNTRPEPKSRAKMSTLRLTPDEIEEIPKDAVFFDIYWTS